MSITEEEKKAVLNSFHGRNMGKKQVSEGRALLDDAIDFLAWRGKLDEPKDSCVHGMWSVDVTKVYKVISDWKKSTVKYWSKTMSMADAIEQADEFLRRQYNQAVAAMDSAGINQWLTRDEMGAVEYGDFEAMFGSRIHEVECTGPEYRGEDADACGKNSQALPGGVYSEPEFTSEDELQDEEELSIREPGEYGSQEQQDDAGTKFLQMAGDELGKPTYAPGDWKEKQEKVSELVELMKNSEFQERGLVLRRAYQLQKMRLLTWKQVNVLRTYAEVILPVQGRELQAA